MSPNFGNACASGYSVVVFANIVLQDYIMRKNGDTLLHRKGEIFVDAKFASHFL